MIILRDGGKHMKMVVNIEGLLLVIEFFYMKTIFSIEKQI